MLIKDYYASIQLVIGKVASPILGVEIQNIHGGASTRNFPTMS